MSVNYVDKSTGNLVRVAGQGKAEYGASAMRSGTIVSETDLEAGAYVQLPIVFSSPMPDDDYIIIITDNNRGYYTFAPISTSKTKNGFSLFVCNDRDIAQGYDFTYNAFKLYTDTEYNNLLDNAILKSDVTDSVTNGNMKPVTSNAVANMCKKTTVLLNNIMANNTDTLITQITLPKGKWIVFGQLHTNGFSGDNLLTLAITTGSSAIDQYDVVDQRRQIVGIWGFAHGQKYFELSAETTIKMYARAEFPSGDLAVIKALFTAIPVA